MKLDILAIGVHPDDVELGCSGVLINEIKLGKKAGILDLTQGELGTRGTIETRYAEAAAAARIIGVQVRENLKMRDGFFKNDEEHQLQLIGAIRKYKPDVVIGNVLDDRHPDHGRAGHMIADAWHMHLFKYYLFTLAMAFALGPNHMAQSWTNVHIPCCVSKRIDTETRCCFCQAWTNCL